MASVLSHGSIVEIGRARTFCRSVLRTFSYREEESKDNKSKFVDADGTDKALYSRAGP